MFSWLISSTQTLLPNRVFLGVQPNCKSVLLIVVNIVVENYAPGKFSNILFIVSSFTYGWNGILLFIGINLIYGSIILSFSYDAQAPILMQVKI